MNFTLHQLQFLEADLRSTEARPNLPTEGPLAPEPDEDRNLRLLLKGSLQIAAFRRRAAVLSQALATEFGLAHLPLLRASKDDERKWRAQVDDRLLRAAFRRRRRPYTPPPRAA